MEQINRKLRKGTSVNYCLLQYCSTLWGGGRKSKGKLKKKTQEEEPRYKQIKRKTKTTAGETSNFAPCKNRLLGHLTTFFLSNYSTREGLRRKARRVQNVCIIKRVKMTVSVHFFLSIQLRESACRKPRFFLYWETPSFPPEPFQNPCSSDPLTPRRRRPRPSCRRCTSGWKPTCITRFRRTGAHTHYTEKKKSRRLSTYLE